MYILGLGSLIAKLFRNIFFLIDSVIYNMIPKIYDLLITIAKTSPLSQADIADMSGRVYKLLAVFMIFKVTFSLIMYVVNPDDFSDKSKGVSKLITNIVISLGMLVLTPYIFNLGYQFQEIILTKNTLGTVIFGDMDAENSTIIDSAGAQMAYIAIRPFITPNLDYFDCAEPYYTIIDENNKKKTVLSKECFGFEDVNTINDSNTACDAGAASNDELKVLCAAASKNKTDKYLTSEIVNNYALGLQYGSHNLLLRRNTVTAYVDEDEEFAFDYTYGISTVVGVLILLFLISTCMDVGLRSIKLAFLQLIAPIPILSYVDPKSGKDGMFKKWYQMAFKTYISLFVRILALYFAIYVIGKIGKLVNVIDGSYTSSCLVTIFIVIGALMFAKNLIKILEALGIKFDGDFQLFPVKKLKEQALGGKQLVGAAGAVGAAALAGGVNAGHRLFNTVGAMRDAWKKVDVDSNGNIIKDTPRRVKIGRTAKAGVAGLARTAGSSVAGVASAGHRGLIKAGKGEGFFKTFGNSYGEAMFSKIQREDLNRKGSTVWGRAKADFNRYIGRLNAAQQQELRYAELESQYNADIKKTKESKEELGRSKAIMEKDKAEKIKVFQQNKEILSKIYESIAGMKNSHANVKDAQEFEDRMKENREFYAKLGDIGRDEHGNKVTVDATNLGKIMTEEGYAAEQALIDQKVKAFKHLKKDDAGVNKYIEILKENGLDESAFTKPNGEFNKAAFEQQDINIRAVNAEYYNQEQSYAEKEKEYAEAEATARNLFIKRLTEAGLDKESAEWVANEADNAARNVKNPQPPGFKPVASVDPRAYTSFTTGVIMGNPPSGPGPVPPSPPPGGGGPAGP